MAAWETMLPLMQEGMLQSREALKQQALTNAMATIEPAILQRVTAKLDDVQKLRTHQVLSAKQSELTRKRADAAPPDQPRYDHYLEAIRWALNGDSTSSG